MSDDDAPPTGALIVLLPDPSDLVAAISTERDPHVTTVWFGPAVDIPAAELMGIEQRLRVVASQTAPFDMAVSGIGCIGPDEAQVVLLESWEAVQFRAEMLTDPDVQNAWMRADQFPTWVCHLTLGYSDALTSGNEASQIDAAHGLQSAAARECDEGRLLPDQSTDSEQASGTRAGLGRRTVSAGPGDPGSDGRPFGSGDSFDGGRPSSLRSASLCRSDAPGGHGLEGPQSAPCSSAASRDLLGPQGALLSSKLARMGSLPTLRGGSDSSLESQQSGQGTRLPGFGGGAGSPHQSGAQVSSSAQIRRAGDLPTRVVRITAVGLWVAGHHITVPLIGPPVADVEQLLSAGLTIPPVLTAADLPVCVTYADCHPEARWYAEKRAIALGVQHMLPSQWAI